MIPAPVFHSSIVASQSLYLHIFWRQLCEWLQFFKSFIHNPKDERIATQQSSASEQKAGIKSFFIAYFKRTLK